MYSSTDPIAIEIKPATIMQNSKSSAQASTSLAAIYHGTFIYCKNPKELSIRHGSLWVDRDGKIGGFTDATAAKLIGQLGWSKDTRVIESGENGFFFPGFVGKCTQTFLQK